MGSDYACIEYMIASCHSSIDIQPAINLQSLAMIELHQKVETFEDNRGKIVSAGNQRNVPSLLSCLARWEFFSSVNWVVVFLKRLLPPKAFSIRSILIFQPRLRSASRRRKSDQDQWQGGGTKRGVIQVFFIRRQILQHCLFEFGSGWPPLVWWITRLFMWFFFETFPKYNEEIFIR